MSQYALSPLATLRDILVGTAVEDEHDATSSAIAYGLTLAKAAEAHLTVQAASWRLSGDVAWLGAFDAFGEAAIDRRLAQLAVSVAENSAHDAAQAGVICTTETPSLAFPEIVSRLAQCARLHDLTVLDMGPYTYDLDRERIEGTLLHSGRPVIVVPPGHDTFAARRIMIAWDGSAQAARAANDALPFLRAAEAVELVSVGGEAGGADAVPGAEFAPHLARHGIAVSVNNLPKGDGIAATLRAQAGLFRADLIVMGAYRHSPSREYFFGGVTRSFLRDSPAPLLLAH